MAEKQTKLYCENDKYYRFDFDTFSFLFLEYCKRKKLKRQDGEISLGKAINVSENTVHSWRNRVNSPVDLLLVKNVASELGANNVYELLIEKKEGEIMKNLNERQIASSKRIFDSIVDALFESKYFEGEIQEIMTKKFSQSDPDYDEEDYPVIENGLQKLENSVQELSDMVKVLEEAVQNYESKTKEVKQDTQETEEEVPENEEEAPETEEDAQSEPERDYETEFQLNYIESKIEKVRKVIAKEYFDLHDTEIYDKYSAFCENKLSMLYFTSYNNTVTLSNDFCSAIKELHSIIGAEPSQEMYENHPNYVYITRDENASPVKTAEDGLPF